MPKIDSEGWRQFREWERTVPPVERRMEAFRRWERLRKLAAKAKAEYLEMCKVEPELKDDDFGGYRF